MCPAEATLIRLLHDELPGARAREVADHVRTCPACGALYSRLRTTWTALGRWEVVPPASDIRGQILRAAAAAATREGITVAARASAGAFWIRVAASVVLAAGAGVAAALAVTRERDAAPHAEVGRDEVVRVLGLEALAGEGPLTAVFEPNAETREGEAVVEEEQS